MAFTYRHYKFNRVRIQGLVTAQNIVKTCAAQKMRPVCDHMNYADGKCAMVGGHWHFSHPSHDRRHRIPVKKVSGAFFYTGRHHTGAMLNTGTSHRWARRNRDKNGDTFCVKRGPGFKTHISWHGSTLYRVRVKGRMVSNNIFKAC